MDYRGQDSNGEGLFGARNENSVLFSLDSLNALDSDASNNGGSAGFGGSGEESGLIDINTLQRMGGGGAATDEGGDVAPIAMESMVFNQVVTKHEKRKTAIIIAIFAVVLIAAVISIVVVIHTKDAERQEEKALAELKLKEDAAKAQELQDKIALLEQQKQQAESDNKRRAADSEAIEAELEKLRNAQANLAAGGNDDADAKSGKKGDRKGGSGSAKSGDSPAPAAPAPAKPAGGGKASVEAVKSALGAVNTKAQKCGKNGNLAVSFSISGGKAKGVQATGGSFKGTATEKCILTVIDKHSWPDGSASGIKYNFKL